MKKQLQLLTAAVVASLSFATAQNSSSVQGNMHIHTGGNLTFFGDVDVPTGGLLRNEAGTLYTRAAVTGEERIQMDDAGNLDIANGTFTFGNETDEKFTNLSIAATGVVEVPPGLSLEITGALTNNNSVTTDSLAGINLYANGTDGYAQLLTSGSIPTPGTVYAQQFLTSKTTAGWRELSSPVNTTLAEVADDYPLYFSNTGTARQWNVWWYDASPATANTGADNPISNTSKANAQYYKPAASGDAFNSGRAYSIYVGGPFFPEITESALSVRGAPGHGNFTYTLHKTHDMGYSNPVATDLGVTPFDGDAAQPASLITGWNLIPNPYPSNIDVEALINGMNLQYEAVHIWDAPNQQYVPVTKDAFPTIDWNTDGTGLVNNNIPPFQAFWVKADLHEFAAGQFGGSSTINGSLALQNSYRTVEKGSSFFKRTPTHIVLRVRNADTTKTDQTIVTLDPNNYDGLDFSDALKMTSPNEEVPTMSTVVEEHPLAINRLAMPEPGHAVPLSVMHKKDGERFFIDAIEYETDASWTLHLFDWKTNTLHDLKNDGIFEFTNDVNYKDGNRFTFYINYKAAGFDPFNNVNIWGGTNGIEVSFANPNSELATIEIMDVSGRRLFIDHYVSTTSNFQWYVDNGQPRLFIVRVTIAGQHHIKRVLL